MLKELPIVEYAAWWILRAAMLITAVYFSVSDKPVYARNIVLLNTLATFAIPILRFISPKALFTADISFRTQTYIDIFILMGSFLGHGLEFLGKINEYDKIMHFVAGAVVVFIGAEVLKAFKGYENISPSIKTFCGVGFSFIFIVLWENMEFLADWLITDSTNQGYNVSPEADDLFVRIFGFGKNLPEQAPVYDTNVDMLFAVVGAIIFAGVLYCVLSHKEKAKAEKTKEAEVVHAE